MSYAIKLRQSIADSADAKANGRAAGEGMWAWYVRAMMAAEPPKTDNDFDAKHKALMGELESIRPMGKDEKNSLSSAKSVIKKCVVTSIDVWKRDAVGNIEKDPMGEPTPRGKSDLQDSKTDFQRLSDMLDNIVKKLNSDTREPFSLVELDILASKMLQAAETVASESGAIKQANALKAA